MTVYEIYCNRCPAWRKSVPTDRYRPITPGSSVDPPSSASGSAHLSQGAEADRRRTSTAHSSGRTTSSLRRPPTTSQGPCFAVNKPEPQESDRHRSRSDRRKDQSDRSSSRDTHYRQSDRSSSHDSHHSTHHASHSACQE